MAGNNINHVDLSGNLTRDPEIRSTQSGTSIVTFTVASNESRKNQQTGEWEDHPNFVDCFAFGGLADWIARDLRKGKRVFIAGKLRYSSWERDGQKRSKIEVMVDNIDFERPPRENRQAQQAPQYQQPTPQYQQPAQPQPVQRQSDDVQYSDIPF